MDKKIRYVEKFFQSGTKESSMRLTLIWSMLLSTIVFMTLCFIIIYCIVSDIVIDWGGMAFFVGGLSTFVGVVVYGKVRQVKSEDTYSDGGGYNPRDFGYRYDDMNKRDYNMNRRSGDVDRRRINKPHTGHVI